MARRSRSTDPAIEVVPAADDPIDDGPIDDAGSLAKLSGDQVASGFAQGIGAVVVVYAIVRGLRALGGFLRSGSRR